VPQLTSASVDFVPDPRPPAASPWGRRIAIVATCLLSLLVCCGLAWWQWDRFTSANGTFQNLGYVLQWPLFGLFPAFMFWRIRKLRQKAEAEATETPERQEAEPAVPAPRPRPDVAEANTDEDEELAAYNRYLRELNARDQQAAE
jgi:DNA-binding transcriptional regulator of glucitol operon